MTEKIQMKASASRAELEPEVPAHAAINATAKIDGGSAVKVLDISETGVVFDKSAKVEVGADVKLKIESSALGKALDLTGLVVSDDSFEGKGAFTVEFTRMNPAHKRVISNYLASQVSGGKTKKAA